MPKTECPDRRRDRYRFAALVASGALLVREAAAAAGVSTRTISRWLRELTASDEPEAEGLRRLMQR